METLSETVEKVIKDINVIEEALSTGVPVKWKDCPDYLRTYLIEYSFLVNEVGELSNSDPLYVKINESVIDLQDIEFLRQFLTVKELKDRLSYENYMLLETETVIESYLKYKEIKQIKREIKDLQDKIKELEKKMRKPTFEEQVETLVYKSQQHKNLTDIV